jgi:hypothetical protein
MGTLSENCETLSEKSILVFAINEKAKRYSKNFLKERTSERIRDKCKTIKKTGVY